MSSVINKLKSQQDFSGALSENLFRIDDIARYGIRGDVAAFAFDACQSLFAVGTVNGFIHVYGQKNVEVLFTIASGAHIRHVRIVKGVYLTVVDSRNHITIFSLETRQILSEYDPSGQITAIETDPGLDWLFIGLENGQILAYDIDRGCVSPYRIGNLQKSVLAKLRMSPVLSLALHPRDPSCILACYKEVAVLFSIPKSEIIMSFRYELTPGAPGGDLNPSEASQFRHPGLLFALWHPNGHHVLTAHVDGSIVFWDAKEGTLLQARTVLDSDVNVPRKFRGATQSSPAFNDDLPPQPILKIAWTCTTNPEETSLLIAGGNSLGGLTVIDFGITPTIAITSFKAMGTFYGSPRRQRALAIPSGDKVIDFIMISRQGNPFYAGNFAPSVVIALLATGDLMTLNYPEGSPIPIGAIPNGLLTLHPRVQTIAASSVPRNQFLGMMTSNISQRIEPLFKGGAPAQRHLRNFQIRNALCTGHCDGSVRIVDASHGELEDSSILEVQLSNALGSSQNVGVTKISLAGETGELSVAVESGQVVLFTFSKNRNISSAVPSLAGLSLNSAPPVIQDIRSRAPPIKEGFLPISLITTGHGPVSCLQNSNIGFVGIGYANGNITLIDRRGPAVIYSSNLSELGSGTPSLRLPSRNRTASPSVEFSTTMEFAIYAIGEDNYSSIVLQVGSNTGRVYTFKILPRPGGGYEVGFEGVFVVADDPILFLGPLDMDYGISAIAHPTIMPRLAQGLVIKAGLIAASSSHVRIFKPVKSKISHKELDFSACAAGISYLRENDSLALSLLTADTLRVYAVPSLRQVAVRPLPITLESKFAKESLVMRNGDIHLRPTSLLGALINIWGRGIKFDDIPSDALYDVMKQMPPHPTISTVQWVKGTQYISIADLDLIIGGPRRPKSKFVLEQERSQNQQRRLVKSSTHSSAKSYDSWKNEPEEEEPQGMFGGIQKAFENLEQSSSEYVNSLNGMVGDAKSNALKASFKAKFFG